MKVKVRQNHWLPRLLKVTGITLYPRIYLADSYEDAQNNFILNHEFIHVAQIRKQGWVKWYLTYLWNYAKMFAIFRNQNEAYLNIPAEAAAYAGEVTTPYPGNVKLVDGVLQET